MKTHDIEQEREDFEAACELNNISFTRQPDGTYFPNPVQYRWEGWHMKAALQSQYREDAERLEWLVENMGRVDIDEGHRGWFVLERDTTNYLVEDCKTFREAIDRARRTEGDRE